MLPGQKQRLTSGCRHCRPQAASSSRRAADIVAGAASLGVWVLLPKCPLCLAAHVAFWTGLRLSFIHAAYARWLLLGLSAALLGYLAVKHTLQARAAGAGFPEK